MKRTLNEVYRLCQKATEGGGAPAGLDVEAGHNSTWLLARDLPGLAGLAAALELLEQVGQTHACRFDDSALTSESTAFDATDKAGALVGPALVDLLVARVDAREARLTVTALSSPLFLLPAAARYVNDGLSFRLDLNSPYYGHFVMTVDKNGIHVLGPTGADITALANGSKFDVTACCERLIDAGSARTPGLAVLVTGETLIEAEARSLVEGVEILELESWPKLQAFANKVLVSTTEASRRLGAGAGLSDNE